MATTVTAELRSAKGPGAVRLEHIDSEKPSARPYRIPRVGGTDSYFTGIIKLRLQDLVYLSSDLLPHYAPEAKGIFDVLLGN